MLLHVPTAVEQKRNCYSILTIVAAAVPGIEYSPLPYPIALVWLTR